MMKRDDGYALSFVLVVLLVLVAIAMAVTSISLRNLQAQQSTINRMEEKYTAQGLVEQVVAQLESASDIDEVKEIIVKYQNVKGEESSIICEVNNEVSPTEYTITAIFQNTKVVAIFKLDPITDTITVPTPTTNVQGESPPPVTTEIPKGHKVIYLSYRTEVTS